MSILNDPGLFGRQWAATYDGTGGPNPAPAVEFLAGLAGDGPALELAIGTGRVALPLSSTRSSTWSARPGSRTVSATSPESCPRGAPSSSRPLCPTPPPSTGRSKSIVRQTIILTDGGVQLKPFAMHYRWPAQIDEHASEAGLYLSARYADWQRQPFGPDSRSHISVYRKP